jgi:hypothetical protein
MGEERKVYRVWVGNPEGKRPLGKQRRRWEDALTMDLGDISWGSVDWNPVGSGYGPVSGCCEYGDEPSGSDAKEVVIDYLQFRQKMLLT